MKLFNAAVTLGLLLTGANATWCQFFYDAACSNPANPSFPGATDNISFDCANPGIFGTGGGFVQCHSTKENASPCLVTTHPAPVNEGTVGQDFISVGDNGVSARYQMTGGAGPWVTLAFGAT